MARILSLIICISQMTTHFGYLLLIFPFAQTATLTMVSSPNLDLSQLGRVALTGDFDAISLYNYEQQNENSAPTNGSQSVLSPLPYGGFATLVSADASIVAMSPFVLMDGTFAGVIIGGNFTSLARTEAQGIAMVDPNNGKITPLTGLSGDVNTLLCDQNSSTVYVGGNFKGGNSTNAIAWVGNAGWANLPFAGFNGPVTTIAQAPNGNILFGGSFTGLGNTTTPAVQDQQVINLSTAKISSGSTTATRGFDDPRNIVCKSNGTDGTGNTWLLEDKTSGFWGAEMNFGYKPTKLRLYNTHQDGRGTRTFRFTAFPINGIMNFTLIDPTTNQERACDSQCPLSNDSSLLYQDFKFVNVIGMNSFKIDISDWYGQGGGLNGIEIFQDGALIPMKSSIWTTANTLPDIFTYAASDLNEPACSVSQFGSNSTVTGPWTVTPSGLSNSEYLTLNISDPNIDSATASVVFQPDIKQSGNYSVILFTPGCQHDQSCDTRGIVNITGQFTSSISIEPIRIFQTNDFDKYDQIYSGPVDRNSDTFRARVTLAPQPDQGNISIVAQSVQFQLQPNSTGEPLNGLFEYNPEEATIDMEFSRSKFNAAGTGLSLGASITSLAVVHGVTYVAGNFSTEGFQNIFSINASGQATSLPNGGLDSPVTTSFLYGNLLYIGGNFSNTAQIGTPGLSNVALYDTAEQRWQPLGQGVNGQVNAIVPLSINITTGQAETCITINGDFDRVLASGSSPAFIATDGMAIWVPSRNDWLKNLNIESSSYTGQLTAATNISSTSPLFAGTLNFQGMSANDAVELSPSQPLNLNPLDIRIQPSPLGSASICKRATFGHNLTGAITGLFYTENRLNITAIGGHFAATASNGSAISNLAFINTTSSGRQIINGIAAGVDTDSAFLALATQGSTLYAGGAVTGNVNGGAVDGLVLWDLAQGTFASPQPQALTGSSVVVNAIAARPNSQQVYVAGIFDAAGSFTCPSICVFQNGQWLRPGLGFGGSVSSLTWQGANTLLVGGNLTVNSNVTSLATYDANKQVWTVFNGASNIPGPVTALSPADSNANTFWIAGTSSNPSTYLMKYDGSNFQSIGDTIGKESIIRGLSMLSVSQDHASNSLVDTSMILLVTGQLSLPNFGDASAALFNGTTFTPFILSNSGNGPGSLSQIFTEKQPPYGSKGIMTFPN